MNYYDTSPFFSTAHSLVFLVLSCFGELVSGALLDARQDVLLSSCTLLRIRPTLRSVLLTALILDLLRLLRVETSRRLAMPVTLSMSASLMAAVTLLALGDLLVLLFMTMTMTVTI